MSNDAIESLLAEASRLYNEGSYRQAIQKWQEVLALDPNNQKAKESVKIAALLSDTWSENADAGPGAEAPAEPPSPEQQELQESLGRIRGMLETRNFQTAMAECEAFAARFPESDEIKQLADQARSGLESAPFIRVALERAARELKTGQFQTVEILCRKVLALDAGNRQARTYLLMAQRRTPGAAGPTEASETPEPASVAPEEAAEPVPPATLDVTESAGPEDAGMTMAIPTPFDPATAPEMASPADAGGADPLAALAQEMGGDISPMDLAGAGEPAGALDPGMVGEAAGAAPQEEVSAYAPMPTPEAGSEVDASQIESIPLGGAPEPGPPQTRRGNELVQEGSIYQGPEGEEAGSAPSPGSAMGGAVPGDGDTAEMAGSSLPPPDLADPTSGGPPPAAPRKGMGRPAKTGAKPAASGAEKEAETHRPRLAPKPSPAAAGAARDVARAVGARVRKAVVSMLVKVAVLALGVGLWIVREEIKQRFFPSSADAVEEESEQDSRPAPRPGVVPVVGPAGTADPAAPDRTPAAAPEEGAGVDAEGGEAVAPAPSESVAAGSAAPNGGTDAATRQAAGANPGLAAAAPAAALASAREAAQGDSQAAESELPADPVARQEVAQKKLAEAQRLINQGKSRQARELLSQALEIDPVLFEARDLLEQIDTQLADMQRFDDDVRTVNRAFEEGDYHSALWKLYRLADAFPTVRTWNYNIAASWYNWGVKLLKAGNCREAIEKLDDTLKINPNDREAIRQKTVAERYLARPKDTAYFSYVDALNLRPLKPMVR